jgi:uncharacterized membrane protein YcaP (DUF421 family)
MRTASIGGAASDPAYEFDLHRIVIGDHPPLFYAEIALRSASIFVVALALLRMSGKRSLGQLSPVDLLIIIALGSAVGDPMFYDDVPVLQGLAVVAVVALITFMIARIAQGHRGFERLVDSTSVILVDHGKVDEAALRRELFEILRQHDVMSLADVRLAILEPSGTLSVLTNDDAQRADGIDDVWEPWITLTGAHDSRPE